MMVCRYCHKDCDGYVQNLPREGDGKAFIYYHHPTNGGWTLHVSSKYRTEVRIKIDFCPMCGRKLKENDDGI